MIKLEQIPRIMDVISNWDNYKTGEEYVAEYFYKVKDFIFHLERRDRDYILVKIVDFAIRLRRNRNNIQVTTDSLIYIYSGIIAGYLEYFFNMNYTSELRFSKRRVTLKIEYGTENFIVPIKSEKLKLGYKIVKKVPRKYNFINYCEIENGRKILLWKSVNGKGIKRIMRKLFKMPTIVKLALKKRQITYTFGKMLLQKGILKKNFRLIPYLSLGEYRIYCKQIRLFNPCLVSVMWRFSNLYDFVESRINTTRAVLYMSWFIVDYDYDNVNQVLLKLLFVNDNWLEFSFLCGVDYKNQLWCTPLQGGMKYWKIRNVYKYMYELDEETKMYEF